MAESASRVSLPVPPWRVSLPPRPLMTSLLEVPEIVSLPEVPFFVQLGVAKVQVKGCSSALPARQSSPSASDLNALKHPYAAAYAPGS